MFGKRGNEDVLTDIYMRNISYYMVFHISYFIYVHTVYKIFCMRNINIQVNY